MHLLTKRHVAETLGASLRTIDALIQRNQLQVVRIGKLVRIEPAEVDRCISERRTSRESGAARAVAQ